jgi:hypothetical protein
MMKPLGTGCFTNAGVHATPLEIRLIDHLAKGKGRRCLQRKSSFTYLTKDRRTWRLSCARERFSSRK